MLEPGLDRHEWEGEWALLQEQLEESPADVLPELDDLVARMLDARGYAISDPVAREGDRDVIADFLAAREITRLLADGSDDVSPTSPQRSTRTAPSTSSCSKNVACRSRSPVHAPCAKRR
jgi:hypothetical protein